jgi:hypothetical protein
MAAPFSLSDSQLQAVMHAAAPLDPSKRLLLVERTAAALRINGSVKPTDADLDRALGRALQGLRQGERGSAA